MSQDVEADLHNIPGIGAAYIGFLRDKRPVTGLKVNKANIGLAEWMNLDIFIRRSDSG